MSARRSLTRRDLLVAVGVGTALPWTPACRRSAPIAAPAPRLDAHLHLTSGELAAWLRSVEGELRVDAVDGAAAVAMLDAAGIGGAVALSGAYLYGGDFPRPADRHAGRPGEAARVAAENDFAAAACAGHPERLVLFCSLNPNRDYALDELERCVADLGARGLKLHLWNADLDPRDERQRGRLAAILEAAHRHRLAVLVHALNGEIEGFGAVEMGQLLELAPMGLRLCFAHAGGAGGYDDQVAHLLDALITARDAGLVQRQRTWIELSAVFPAADQAADDLLATAAGRARLAAQLVDWGLDHILWGSDGDPTYLDATQRGWPLGASELATVLAADGRELLAGDDQRVEER